MHGKAFEFMLGLGQDPENEIRRGVGGTAVTSDNTSKLLFFICDHTIYQCHERQLHLFIPSNTNFMDLVAFSTSI